MSTMKTVNRIDCRRPSHDHKPRGPKRRPKPSARSVETRNLLVQENLSLVKSAVRRWCGWWVLPFARRWWDDLMSAGYLGLVHAADIWQEDGLPFVNFARYYVKYAVIDEYRSLSRHKAFILRGNWPAEDERPRIDAAIDAEVTTTKLTGLLGLLSERDQRIIILRFGLDGHEPHSCKAIAAELGIKASGGFKTTERPLARLAALFGVKPAQRT